LATSKIEKPKQLLLFRLLFTLIFLVQGIVHLIANDALVILLPGDGCGQILDIGLQKLIEASLLVAYIVAALFAFSFAWTVTYGGGNALLVMAALFSISSFVVGGSTGLYFYEHLTACDVNFFSSDAPMLNFGAAGLLLALTILSLLRGSNFKETAP